ncbi:hypothetical protein AAES_80014 [Amazona aestiva]|uniref:Uncharacterized protein n=1 Tax=Amazona aestiva TaxID=12930 RepID=A0A0Q3Q044_AMAAE|nr:hypothetical protein AAES_80014 [Amazona aestiva]
MLCPNFSTKTGTRWYKKLISCVTGNTDRNEMVQEADKLRGRVRGESTEYRSRKAIYLFQNWTNKVNNLYLQIPS